MDISNKPKAKRYSAEEKAEVLEFIADHKAHNSRGAQKAAAEKYKISSVTISSWVKASKKKPGRKPGSKLTPSRKVSLHIESPCELRELAGLLEQIAELEALTSKLEELRAKADEIQSKILG